MVVLQEKRSNLPRSFVKCRRKLKNLEWGYLTYFGKNFETFGAPVHRGTEFAQFMLLLNFV